MPRAWCLLACFVLLAAGCSETFESHYSDRQEAQRDGVFERGWLPDWLPASATDIREIHNLDTNEGAFSFSVQAGWSPPEAAGCAPSSQVTAPRIRFRHFPSKIEQRTGILKCGDVLVLATERTVFAWR
jgi:hypothetical protein